MGRSLLLVIFFSGVLISHASPVAEDVEEVMEVADRAAPDGHQNIQLRFPDVTEVVLNWRRTNVPVYITVKTGSTIRFVWGANKKHNLAKVSEPIFRSCEFNPPPVDPFPRDSPGMYEATKAGTFFFISGVHGDCMQGMKAKIIVED